MLRRIVDASLENRALVLIATILVVVGGVYALTQLPIDAVPDITNVQVQVLTKAPALGAVEMEQFVTYPIEAHGWTTRWSKIDSQRRMTRLWESTILKR